MKKNTLNIGKPKPKKNKKRLIFLGLGILTTSILSYFGLQYWKKNKQTNSEGIPYAPDIKATKPRGVKATSKAPQNKKLKQIIPNKEKTFGSDAFPLKKGSKGDKVRKLQIALIQQYGKTVLPKEGAVLTLQT